MPRRAWFLPPALAVLVVSMGCRTQPAPIGETPTARPEFDYTVHYVDRGETLYAIGRTYGVPWRKIQRTNGSLVELRVGQPLLIPLHERTQEPVQQPPPRVPRPTVQRPVPGTPEARSVSRKLLHRDKPFHRFWWPTAGRLVRGHGASVRGFAEPGVGLSAPAGTEVCAVASGTVICVVRAGRSPRAGWGNVISIRHAGDVVSWYGYLDRVLVEGGQKVSKGERIGTVGSSGAAPRPELALRFFRAERPVDPLDYLP